MSIKLKTRNTISDIDYKKIRKITEMTSQLKTEANIYPKNRTFSCNFDDLHMKKIVEKTSNLLTEEQIRKFITNSLPSKTIKLKIQKCTESKNLYNTIIKKNLQINSEDRLKLRNINKKIAKDIKNAEILADTRDSFKLLCKSVRSNKNLKYKLDSIISYKSKDNQKVLNSKLKGSDKMDVKYGTSTLLFKNNDKRGDYLEQVVKFKNDQLPLKKAMKMKSIKWLLDNKKCKLSYNIRSSREINKIF